MFGICSRPARPLSSPIFAQLTPIHQILGQMSPSPGGLPWLLCPKALSPPQYLSYLKRAVVSLYLLPVSSSLDWALWGHGLCCLALSPSEEPCLGLVPEWQELKKHVQHKYIFSFNSQDRYLKNPQDRYYFPLTNEEIELRGVVWHLKITMCLGNGRVMKNVGFLCQFTPNTD